MEDGGGRSLKLIITLDDAEVAALGGGYHGLTAENRMADMVASANGRADAQGAQVYFADQDETMTITSMVIVPERD